MDAPVAIEVDFNSILLGWIACPDALAYELQMQTDDDEWTSLSTSIKATNIRKKNLVEGTTYRFRIRPHLPHGWDLFSPPSSELQILASQEKVIDAPVLASKDGSSVTIIWPEVESCEGYSLRFRSEQQLGWSVVDSVLRSNKAKKKGLLPGEAYYFSVRPVGLGDEWQFSRSSLPLAVAQLSQFLSNLFPSRLLTASGGSSVPTNDVLAGKIVAVYFSAHWCGPCRNFTPKLASLYTECKSLGRPIEIVFCSGDNSEDEFKDYFSSMPWLALDYGDDEREGFMAKFKVSGIPKLSILAPSGHVIMDNAAAANLSLATVDQWIQQCAGQLN